MTATDAKTLGRPLVKLDKQALRLFRPYRKTPPMRVLDALSKVTDQPQLRVLCGGLFVLGLVRADPRMMRAGARMLLAHETANFAKDTIKRRIDRRRPRSEYSGKADKPSKGRHTAKEMTSFPSGHSAGSMAVACAYAAVYPERRVPVLAASAGLATSRVLVAAHYPTDVAAGLTLGAGANGALTLAGRGLRRVALAALGW